MSRHIECVVRWGNIVGDFLFYPDAQGNSGFDARVFGYDMEFRNVIYASGYSGGSSGTIILPPSSNAIADFTAKYILTIVTRTQGKWGAWMGEDWADAELDMRALSNPLMFQAYGRYVIPNTHQCIECGMVYTDSEMDGQQYEIPETYPVVWKDSEKEGDPEEKLMQVMTGRCEECQGLVYRAALDTQSPPTVKF